ncbi:MAG: Ig-like domain-containing protein [Gemmatimonadaceae bacterium]|nr:Ig-like domain-containing protein [Gemmatimonadaceae bacterium]
MRLRLLALSLLLAGCNKIDLVTEPTFALTVRIAPREVALLPQETRKLTATVTKGVTDPASISWASRNTTIATIDQDGTVRARAVGQVFVLVSAVVRSQEALDSIVVTVGAAH